MNLSLQLAGLSRRCFTAVVLPLALCATLQAQSTAQRKSLPPSAPTPQPSAPRTVLASGTPLDRVVAIVNGDLILDSDVDQERRFETLQPFRDAINYTRSQMIERLINRSLILQQSKLQPEDNISDADVNKELDALRKNNAACKQEGCTTQVQWDKFLAAHGFTAKTFADRWRERMEVLRFIEQRFRMGTRITPEEIKDYYEKTMLPEYAKRHVPAPKLEVLSDRIQEVLLEQRVSSLLGDWLKSLRAQGSVVVLHPGEEAP
ncbi:MAG: peptidylprolyl isomerase [Acidobacteriota bacterium]